MIYYDHTPKDYEPPHFHAGDVRKDKWYFSTHDVSEKPERCSIGSVRTGFHSVDVKIASISGFLPSVEDNNAPFMGTTHARGYNAPAMTPLEEAAVRVQQTEAQRQDALERRILWDADNGLCDVDADGEDDPECAPGNRILAFTQSLVGLMRRTDDSGVEFVDPVGTKDEDGAVVLFTSQRQHQRKKSGLHEANYFGQQERVAQQLAQLVTYTIIDTGLSETHHYFTT